MFVPDDLTPLLTPATMYAVNIKSTPPYPVEQAHSISIHGHPMRIAAEFPVRSWADGPASSVPPCSAALLQRKKLLGTESFVVDLRSRFDEILKVGASEEVAEVHEFAMVLVLDVDNPPTILSATNLTTANND